MSLSLVTLCLALVADEPIEPEKAAAVERAQARAQAEVAAKYGNKKSSELSQDERRQMVKDQADADRAVLEKLGVDAKQWARESLRRDRDQYAKNKALVKEQDGKEKADEERKKAAATKKDVEVQRGINEDNPVTLDEKSAEGQVGVEQGLPPDVVKDLKEVSGEEGGEAPSVEKSADEPAPKPARDGKGDRPR
jgi:hypothetical protein